MSFTTNRPIFDKDPFLKDINDTDVKKDSDGVKIPAVKENNWIFLCNLINLIFR